MTIERGDTMISSQSVPFFSTTKQTNNQLAMKMLRLSSSQRINKAADDAAGLAISEGMRGQIRGDRMATRNMEDFQSLTRTAEGALSQSHDIFQRMRQLAVQANNGTLTESDRNVLQKEFSQIRETLDAIGRDTEFNTQPLLDGSFTNKRAITNANGQSLQLSIDGSTSDYLGSVVSGQSLADVDLSSDPRSALGVIDESIARISHTRSTLGSTDNRLNYAGSLAQTHLLNLQQAESRIRDADIAAESIQLNQYLAMQQAQLSAQNMGIGMSGMQINLLQ
ncbi:flagellin [Salipaludibacillus daqingensis]|uniref:flagellin N-terminal helical domain-containing protein n=1 Tax=Salipaludibacillus daqingensis TaxID=3041001 RepID=UPI002473C8E6|nr:flagellin [Salipaludibacillus daqingensis]